jgi:opacity protein-like surface antigen
VTSSFPTKVLNAVRLLVLGCAICLVVQPAAADTPSIVELQRTIAALEARVSALETQMKQGASVDDQEQQASQPALVLAALSQLPTPSPMHLGHTEHPINLPLPDPAFSGFYFGTSFGVGVSSAKSRYRNTFESSSLQTQTGNLTDVDNNGVASLVQTTSTYASENDSLTSGTSSADHHIGALGDLYLGANFHPTPRTLLGVQVEGSLAEMSFDTKFKQQTENFSSTSSNSYTTSSSTGSSSQSTSSNRSQGTNVYQYPEIAQAKLDWMTSVIGRAGWLATPTTLVYGLGGWTYGRFELDSYNLGLLKVDDYGAQGFTVGGGVEKKLSRSWSLRAEYRYTNFGDKRIFAHDHGTDMSASSGPTQSSYSSISSGLAFSSSSAGTSSYTTQRPDSGSSLGHIDADMQIGRIGFTRYFGGS